MGAVLESLLLSRVFWRGFWVGSWKSFFVLRFVLDKIFLLAGYIFDKLGIIAWEE